MSILSYINIVLCQYCLILILSYVNIVAGIDAVFAIPDQYWPYITDQDPAGVYWRVSCCAAYAVVVLVLLYFDKVDLLGVFLGIVMMLMVALFLAVVCFMTINLKK